MLHGKVPSEVLTPGRSPASIWMRALQAIRHALPQGRTLPDRVWQRRHHALLALLWMHAVGLLIFGRLQGYDLAHNVAHIGAPALFAAVAMIVRENRRLAAALVSVGLITSSALLVHIWDGVIEAHFHFFVMIALLSLYEDWLPFLLAAGYVVLHHGVTGMVDPGAVYNHRDAIEHPWKWAAIHGAFVAAAGVASVLAWRLNEDVRAETERAYDRARENEELFRGAFDEAPIGMALASVDPAQAGRFVQVNRALCEFTGYSEEQLLERTFASITHPDDAPGSAAGFERLVAGEQASFRTEMRYMHTDGRLLWANVSISLVYDAAGKPAYAIGQIEDIGERKRAEEQLEHEALHDALTGLGNRRAFFTDFDRRLAAATRDEPLTLVLLDLDGFKAYNDTFGHPAGDALLARLGRSLAAAVEGFGTPYRFGGDEFCVMGPCTTGAGQSLGAIAAAALAERGEGFDITASRGSVLVPAEADAADEAVRIADGRMYARKGLHSRASAGRQTTDVLLKVLAERSPELGTHLNGVTESSAAVGRRLGLPEEDLGPLLQAASLHDVGKAAIPDELLSKPGPLDADEWTFMRRHPVIGERILSAAPALSVAAKLVRSSHERYDGTGYPDGLAGDEIPLGARIIAVCDAFDAMTRDRPYRAAVTPAGAVEELRACAGSHFDAAIVDAFIDVMVARDDEEHLTEGSDPSGQSAIPA